MATNNFKNAKARLVGLAAVSVLTAPAGTKEFVLVGATLCNRTLNTVKADMYITDAGGDTYFVDDVEIPAGASLVAIGGEQKVALMANDVVKVKADTASSLDVILSYLEITP